MYCMESVDGIATLSTVSTSWMNTGGLFLGTGFSFKAATASVTVAVKSKVCASSDFGNTENTLWRSPPNELLNNASASSNTKNFTLASPHMVSSPALMIWSANAPGVAITKCGALCKFNACCTMSSPPTITETLMFIVAPKAANCSAICNANSLVGVRMSPKIADGSSDHLVNIGAPNAIVLPDPVFAPPIQSCPARIFGMHASWIDVGV